MTVTDWRADLDRLATLPANWDDAGSLPIHGPVIDRAEALIAILPTLPDMVDPLSGGVLLTWQRSTRLLEVEVYADPQPLRSLYVTDGIALEDTTSEATLTQWVMDVTQ